LNKILILIPFLVSAIVADEVHSLNKKANRLYDKGKYAESLSLYEEAAGKDPKEKKLAANKGSALYRLQDFDKAEQSYKDALSIEDAKTRAAVLYNMGNVYNMQGDQLAQAGNQQAMEKYKAARDSYIKSLDVRPEDRDAKWNLQLTQMKIKEMEKQQQQQQNQDQNQQDKQDQQNQDQNKQNQDKKDQQNKQNQQDKQDQQKQDQQQQDKQDQEKQQNEQQKQEQQDAKKEEQKQQPQPKPSKEEMEKEEALRLILQYADDDKELNKPQKIMKPVDGKKPEKDW